MFMLQPIDADITWCELTPTNSDGATEDDQSVLVAALEEIQARRVAIEWLLEGDLLRMCLV
jgi:hypothetical protein